MAKKKQVRLSVLGSSSHTAAWRHPDVDPTDHISIDAFRRLVEIAERGKFDLLFLADVLGAIGADEKSPDMFQRASYGLLEPMTLLAALSTYTKHLGLVATMSTSINSPWQIARVLGSLDHMSHGRAGWNVVTTQSTIEQALTTAPLEGKDSQYERAREVVECVFDFWDGWAEDSFPRDREGSTFVSLDKARIPNREGKYYRLTGPLNQPRPPQGRPVILQACSSEIGRELGAQIGDIAFTVQPTLPLAQAFYKDMKARAARLGRDPDSLLIMPGLYPYVAATRAEAQALKDQLLDCLDPQAAIGEVRRLCDVDFSGHDLDGPIPDLGPWRGKARNTAFFNVIGKYREDHPDKTVLDLLRHLSGGRGHPEIVGSTADVADMIEQWVDEDGADGLLIMPPLLPYDLERFVDLVVPELQRRGRFRTEYEHATLRGNLGLPTPRR